MCSSDLFAEALGTALLVSQCQSPGVHALYRARLGCEVVGIPNTGVDPSVFRCTSDPDRRPIDLGYRADASPFYLGHDERRQLAGRFQRCAPGLGLSIDVSLRSEDRFAPAGWAAFLNRCRGQLGTEAGGDFFALDDRYRRQVNAYLTDHPDASFDDVHARFFRAASGAVPLRIISGRNVEAAATRTVQLLMEGEYGGWLRADEHYIALRRDLSNVDEAVEKFRDRGFCRRLIDAAEDLALREFTYDRLVGHLYDAVAPLAA